MSTEAFKQKALQKPGFIQRILNKKPSENFLIEVNNLFSSQPITDITQAEISSLINKYGNKVSKTTLKGLYSLYSDYLFYCLKDKMLSKEEISELEHLKNILSLNDTELHGIHNNITSKIYKKTFREVIEDRDLSENEQTFLDTLQRNLLLPDELANEISEEVRKTYIQEYVQNAVSDERLSPDEEKRLELICKSLNVNLSYEDATKEQLAKYKLYWTIENGEIPEIDVPISLGKQEVCYFRTSADWYEKRTVTKRLNYSGPTASIRIMKGVRYRAGSLNIQRVKSEEWKHLNSGTLYLTNKRLIFTGNHKSSIINLNKILSFIPYSDGVEISKETGRSPLLQFTENNELFVVILSRLLNN